MNAAMNKGKTIDPRVKILLLLIINFMAFSKGGIKMTAVLFAYIFILSWGLGIKKTAVKMLGVFLVLLGIKYVLMPLLPLVVSQNLNIIFTIGLRLMPSILAAVMLVKTTPIRVLMYALEKMHVPANLIVPLTITIRYFPAIKEEFVAISDVMKMREVEGFLKKIEYAYMPLLLTASNTAEELGQAIIARGIDHPAKKTCAVELKFTWGDVCLLLCSVTIGIVFMIN